MKNPRIDTAVAIIPVVTMMTTFFSFSNTMAMAPPIPPSPSSLTYIQLFSSSSSFSRSSSSSSCYFIPLFPSSSSMSSASSSLDHTRLLSTALFHPFQYLSLLTYFIVGLYRFSSSQNLQSLSVFSYTPTFKPVSNATPLAVFSFTVGMTTLLPNTSH